MRPTPKPTLLLAAVLLTGCTLIDQNTFNPNAGLAPVIPPAPKPPPPPAPGPLPLLSVSPGANPADYAAALRKAVAAARARKPTVVFDVVEMQPPDTAADAPLGAEALAVARSIVGEGVPPARVRLAARPDAAAPAREVRVYIR